jgi:arylsulfatase A-like enzyme
MIQHCRIDHGYGDELAAAQSMTEPAWRAYLHTYYQLVQAADRALGHVLAALAAGGWSDNTLVVFTSDHGEGMAAHRWAVKRGPYEETIRVPFIVVPPATTRRPHPRVEPEHLVSALDLYPTLLDYAGCPLPETPFGHSLRPLLEDQPTAPLRDHLLISLDPHPRRPRETARILITRDFWKYVACSHGQPHELLFNLREDPGETTNLACTAPHHLPAFRTRLTQVLQAQTDPFQPAWL